MAPLAKGRKKRKKPSEFQKLWARAEKLKQRNERFRHQLDKIAQRMVRDVKPAEEDAARAHIPLLRNLLKLARRKSLTQWERMELDEWIHELADQIAIAGLLDGELQDEVARYHAFRLDIELDESSDTPLANQLLDEIGPSAEEQLATVQQMPEIEEMIERILDETLGPCPAKPKKDSRHTDDLFADELEAETARVYEEYQKRREEERERLMQEMLEAANIFDDENVDPDEAEDAFSAFDGSNPFDGPPAASADTDSGPLLSNDAFNRLFRSTASKLHPDRESDMTRREEKHRLMSQLLAARKEGDVMAVIDMYRQHVGDDDSLPAADEQQLIAALRQQIATLEEGIEDYSCKSPLHRAAYEMFYFANSRKTDQAFREHLRNIRRVTAEAERMGREIRTLKTLKPVLAQRYDDRAFDRALARFGIPDEGF